MPRYAVVMDSRKSQKQAKSPIFILPDFVGTSPSEATSCSSNTASMNCGHSTGAHNDCRPPSVPVIGPTTIIFGHRAALFIKSASGAISPIEVHKHVFWPVLQRTEDDVVDVLITKAEPRNYEHGVVLL